MRGYCALEVVVGDKRWMAMRGEKKKKKSLMVKIRRERHTYCEYES
jgi:hypothetical protein